MDCPFKKFNTILMCIPPSMPVRSQILRLRLLYINWPPTNSQPSWIWTFEVNDSQSKIIRLFIQNWNVKENAGISSSWLFLVQLNGSQSLIISIFPLGRIPIQWRKCSIWQNRETIKLPREQKHGSFETFAAKWHDLKPYPNVMVHWWQKPSEQARISDRMGWLE